MLVNVVPVPDAPESVHHADHELRRTGESAAALAWPLLSAVGDLDQGIESITALKAQIGTEDDGLERLLLWHAAQQALPRVSSLPIDALVRLRLAQDLPQLHTAPIALTAGAYHFNRAAKLATLRRFPAGPMEWELSGIPRSFFLQARFPANLQLGWFVASRLHRRGPCFFMHVAPSPRNRALVLEREVLRAYYQMVRSMEMQPGIRALIASAWFHDPAAVRDHPHLAPLSRPYLEEGGLITLLGPVAPSSGVLEGNSQRRKAFVEGRVLYRSGLAVWPREPAIRWVRRHPELGALTNR